MLKTNTYNIEINILLFCKKNIKRHFFHGRNLKIFTLKYIEFEFINDFKLFDCLDKKIQINLN